jgi:hypothetical protein
VANEPGLGELGRQIESFRREVRDDLQSITQRLDTFVLREVYASDEQRRTEKFKAIEEELARNRANRFLMATLAVTAFIAPMVVGIIVFLVTRSLR